MAKVTIKEPCATYGIRTVEPGDAFRYANGKNTDKVFIALYLKEEGYNLVMDALCLNTGERRRIYTNTRKERVVQYVRIEDVTVRDIGDSSRSDYVIDMED